MHVFQPQREVLQDQQATLISLAMQSGRSTDFRSGSLNRGGNRWKYARLFHRVITVCHF